MAEPSDSFKQFDYAIRPSKQVERKIMIEVLLGLPRGGYDLRQYRYLGFGSPFYVDFVMFHKYLFIREMVCVEWADVERRMRFNKPFKFIKLRLCPLSAYIPTMRRTKRHLVWLDYDRSLDPDILEDIDGCLNRVAAKSVLVITVDARPKPPDTGVEAQGTTAENRELLTAEAYRSWFGRYIDKTITREAIARVHVAPLFYDVVIERIRQTLTTRGGGLRFLQIFNFFYRDGAPMWTVGGVVGTAEDEGVLRDAGVFNHPFVRTGKDYLTISVPPLTVREKHWLDSRLDPNLTAAKLAFELDEKLLENYRKFYKQYPTYMETLL